MLPEEWTMPLPNLTSKTNETIRTLTYPKHAVARQRRWLARERGRMIRMPLRRRSNEPEKIPLSLRRSGISWQAKKYGRTEKHTPRWLRGVRGMQRHPNDVKGDVKEQPCFSASIPNKT